MFASHRQPPAETPAVTVQSPVAVSPPDDPTLPTLPEDASKDRPSSRQNIRITPDAEMDQSDEEGTLKPNEKPVVTRLEQLPPRGAVTTRMSMTLMPMRPTNFVTRRGICTSFWVSSPVPCCQ